MGHRPQKHIVRFLTRGILSEVRFIPCKGDSHVLALGARLVLALGPGLVLALGPGLALMLRHRLVLGRNLVSSLLEELGRGLEGQEEKGCDESEGPHG